jgi:hypothetical protein
VPIHRSTACLIFDIDIESEPSWKEGPLPLNLASSSIQSLSVEQADIDARMGYFQPRVRTALYGRPDKPSRWYEARRETVNGHAIFGVEIIQSPSILRGHSGVGVVHLELTGAPVNALHELRDLSASPQGKQTRKQLGQVLAPGTTMGASQNRATTVAHVTFADGPDRVLPPAYDDWDPSQQWLWLLASATPPDSFLPDLHEKALFDGTVYFSQDWRALVLRDGVAFLGLTPDPEDTRTFHHAAETYVHTIYLDVVVLGQLQKYALNQFADDIASTDLKSVTPDRLARFEERLFGIRNELWLRHVTIRGKGNELLERYQDQNHLSQLHESIVSDLADFARFVDAVTNRRITTAVGLITVLGLPLGLAYAGGQVWGRASPVTLAICTAIATTVAIIFITLIPAVRGMLHSLFRHDDDIPD